MGQLSSRLPGADKNARRDALKTFKDDLYTGALVQTSLLCTQCPDTLDICLEYLSLSDLLALSCTCKTLYIAVLAYIKHICNKSGLEEAYTKFLDKNKQLLTLVEQGAGVLGELGGLDMGKSVEELTSSERRQLWFLAKWKEFYYLETRRISVTNDSVHFPHKGSHHIPIQQAEELGRDICYLSNVCWLHICHSFTDVKPGVYNCSLVIKVLKENHMPFESGRDGVDWIVNDTEVLLRTYKDFWIELANGRTPADEHLNGLKLDIVDDRVVEEKWVRLTTPQFRMEEKGTVKFEFKDIENGWWKSGILFDFMELKKIRDLSI